MSFIAANTTLPPAGSNNYLLSNSEMGFLPNIPIIIKIMYIIKYLL